MISPRDFAPFDDEKGAKIGVAVSGGGDSVALLRLLSDADDAPEIYVYTVDHGLRPEAADEARFVAQLCAQLGHTHRALSWKWDGQGNLSASARKGRYDAISDVAKADGVETVFLGHTRDDQAETVLMALTRSAGVDGLSAMQPSKQDRGILWKRPLLGMTRAELRAYLKELGQDWIDDPSNDNEAYERVRMRKASDLLSDLGLSTAALANVAANMQTARDALESASQTAWASICTEMGGAIRIDRAEFAKTDFEIRRRLLIASLSFVAPTAASPRRDVVNELACASEGSVNQTVSGCMILFKPNHIWVVREPNAVKGVESFVSETWDDRWRVHGPDGAQQMVIRALGENGLSYCQNWRETGLPRPALLSAPSIWKDERLIAAPIAGYGGEWSAELVSKAEDFLS